jgi:hypothetical protein
MIQSPLRARVAAGLPSCLTTLIAILSAMPVWGDFAARPSCVARKMYRVRTVNRPGPVSSPPELGTCPRGSKTSAQRNVRARHPFAAADSCGAIDAAVTWLWLQPGTANYCAKKGTGKRYLSSHNNPGTVSSHYEMTGDAIDIDCRILIFRLSGDIRQWQLGWRGRSTNRVNRTGGWAAS